MKTWKLTVNEEELKALIWHHSHLHLHSAEPYDEDKPDVERSARIHDLTKRLNRETPEIETEVKNESAAINNEAQQQTSGLPPATQEWK